MSLSLRPWRQEDAAAVLAAFSAPEMTRQADEPVDSLDSAASWIDRRTRDRDAGTAYAFAVADGNGTVLGNAAVGAVNRTHSTGWVSYWTTPDARGRGVAAYGCAALARWAFDELGLFRLELGHRTNNPASCHVARTAGFAVEGLQRQKLAYDGVRYDVELHARLASDAG
ncbi:GNAT family N-acetyltransferase [Streptomyces atriruber]|uniref:GNAT family N-acetyltransferase n=1 Tax=Streptomyces atriruber TaxID=545121 RepID=UPI0006E3B180|nr:GNAT family protein [Streptomyces atriruber]